MKKDIESIDLSNIERGSGQKGSLLNETYLTKIEETTHEEFKTILNFINDRYV